MMIRVDSRIIGGKVILNISLPRVLDNPLMRNFAKLFAGTALAKLVGLMAMPIVARLVSPGAFGEFSIFFAITSVVAPLLALSYVDAIPIPKSSIAATNILTLALVLIVINSTLLLFMALMLENYIASVYPFINIHFLIYLYFAVVGWAIFEALNIWAVRVRNYSIIARTQISQALIGAGAKVLLSYFVVPMALMLGQIAQNFTGVLPLLRSRSAPYKKHSIKLSKSLLKKCALQYVQYPKYRLAAKMLLVVNQALPVMVVGKIYGQDVAGQLGLAFMAVSAPVMMIVQNVRKLYYGEAAKLGASRPRELSFLTIRIMVKMMMLAFPGCILMFFFAEPVFIIVFGELWQLAGSIASVYAFYVFGLFVSGAFSDLANVLGCQKAYLRLNVFRLIICAAIFSWASQSEWEVLNTLLIFSIAMLIYYFSTFLYFFSLIKKTIVSEKRS